SSRIAGHVVSAVKTKNMWIWVGGGAVLASGGFYYFNSILPNKVYERAKVDLEKRTKDATVSAITSAKGAIDAVVSDGGQALKISGIDEAIKKTVSKTAEKSKQIMRNVSNNSKDHLHEANAGDPKFTVKSSESGDRRMVDQSSMSLGKAGANDVGGAIKQGKDAVQSAVHEGREVGEQATDKGAGQNMTIQNATHGENANSDVTEIVTSNFPDTSKKVTKAAATVLPKVLDTVHTARRESEKGEFDATTRKAKDLYQDAFKRYGETKAALSEEATGAAIQAAGKAASTVAGALKSEESEGDRDGQHGWGSSVRSWIPGVKSA
ncbi:hypothetical protein HDU93_009111, partial [Gonapodya sp. JEL0774]